MIFKKTSYYILFIYFIINSVTLGQTNELGVFIGGSMFHGDIGYQNAENSLYNTRASLGLEFKRNFNYHLGLKLSVLQGEIQGFDNLDSDIYIQERNLMFRSKLTEIALLLEFNFRPYLSRDMDYNYTPFIFSGISNFYFDPKGKSIDGKWHSLRPLATEGQGSDLYPNKQLYSLHGISIPIGIGYKINVYEFLTLSMSISWRMTFTDYIDDVSTIYVDESILNDLGNELADQSENNFASGFQRGNPYNNDKYGFVGISILYSIQDPKKDCNNIIY